MRRLVFRFRVLRKTHKYAIIYPNTIKPGRKRKGRGALVLWRIRILKALSKKSSAK